MLNEKMDPKWLKKGPKFPSVYYFTLPFSHKHTFNSLSKCASKALVLIHAPTHTQSVSRTDTQHTHTSSYRNSQKDAISTSNSTLIKLFEFLIWAWLHCCHQRKLNTTQSTHTNAQYVTSFAFFIALFHWVEFAMLISADETTGRPSSKPNEWIPVLTKNWSDCKGR